MSIPGLCGGRLYRNLTALGVNQRASPQGIAGRMAPGRRADSVLRSVSIAILSASVSRNACVSIVLLLLSEVVAPPRGHPGLPEIGGSAGP